MVVAVVEIMMVGMVRQAGWVPSGSCLEFQHKEEEGNPLRDT